LIKGELPVELIQDHELLAGIAIGPKGVAHGENVAALTRLSPGTSQCRLPFPRGAKIKADVRRRRGSPFVLWLLEDVSQCL